ncbi:phage head-tail adaptor, putative, SPP1 family [Pseudomonas lundensis]|uniref:phage head closure protein n=1 Tax=Pseudomonas lundensis TaxID=86185 RepID=UPI000886C881|nr:phage head closure protein [Pseudomonas lundensis]NNA18191.1 phage head closure protein [Pseudomonas lundensis]SDQ57513.1 phage head-tail adaptor, putative, SPP1 family [Pseudomonas lundensis]
MRAGPLRHRCSVQSIQEVPDGYGGYSEDWVELRKVWAEITTPTGRVKVVADQVVNLVTAEIRVRYAPALVAQMRIIHSGTTYLIEAALPDNERSMLRLLCSNVPNP